MRTGGFLNSSTATYSSFSPEVREISFQYQSAHDPAAPDGNQSTAFDHFDPEYYAQAIVRASQYPAGPDEGEWKFVALTIRPNGNDLREWDKDAVTELGHANVDIPNLMGLLECRKPAATCK